MHALTRRHLLKLGLASGVLAAAAGTPAPSSTALSRQKTPNTTAAAAVQNTIVGSAAYTAPTAAASSRQGCASSPRKRGSLRAGASPRGARARA